MKNGVTISGNLTIYKDGEGASTDLIQDARTGVDVAIVGAGPRGLSVLERLLVRVGENPLPDELRIWVFDPDEPGAGRIWRTTQPEWFLMNTAAGEVTVYSGGPTETTPRAGSGPSLAQWLATHPDPRWAALGPDDYAPRAVYGQYLNAAYRAFVEHAPPGMTVHHVPARVHRIERRGAETVIHHSGGSETVDRTVLTTGHARTMPDPGEHALLRFATARPGLRYLRGDSAADIDLDSIAAGEDVGVIGLGLTFLDVVAHLTVGRGGRFTTAADGSARYLPSGAEPRIHAGSRSGLVMLGRGRNQKAPDYRYQASFVTEAAIAAARRRAQVRDGSAQIGFVRDVLPLLEREVEHVYYTTYARRRRGAGTAQRFAESHLRCTDAAQVAALLARFGLADVPQVDLTALARPFDGERFTGPDAFRDRTLDLLADDLREATEGNLDNPLKAALDILRDTRGAVRAAVDFAGLRPDSHREEFLGWFNAINTMVSAGPPAVRVGQVCALLRTGTLRLVGPQLQVTCDEPTGTFLMDSPQVLRSRRAVTTLVDARIPRAQVDRTADPLLRGLFADGLITEHVNTDPVTGEVFGTGGVAVTRAPFHVVDRCGHADPHLYALGIPTENTRWFTQIGNGRPGPLSGFHTDADAIARDMLRAVPATAPLARAVGTSA
jgi:uncharacterized NAD(P)/FAD-binding protein YdhS